MLSRFNPLRIVPSPFTPLRAVLSLAKELRVNSAKTIPVNASLAFLSNRPEKQRAIRGYAQITYKKAALTLTPGASTALIGGSNASA